MERVLVTGITGFTGSHLVQFLRQEAGVPAELHGVSRTAGKSPEGVRFWSCDLSDAAAVHELVATVQPTKIYHLAGSFSNEFSVDYAGNVTTTRNLLEGVGALPSQSCRMLVVGSAAEYGRVGEGCGGVSELQPVQPISTYGLTKVFQTALAQFYARVHKIPVIIVRPFNLIGSGASNRLFIGRLEEQIRALTQGKIKEITLGNLSGSRDFIDVRDAVRAYVVALERGERGEVYNVGSGHPTSVEKFVRVALACVGIGYEKIISDRKQHSPSDASTSFFADVTKLKRLGWCPELSIEASAGSFVSGYSSRGGQ